MDVIWVYIFCRNIWYKSSYSVKTWHIALNILYSSGSTQVRVLGSVMVYSRQFMPLLSSSTSFLFIFHFLLLKVCGALPSGSSLCCTVSGCLFPREWVIVSCPQGAFSLIFIVHFMCSTLSSHIGELTIKHFLGEPRWIHPVDVSLPAEAVMDDDDLNTNHWGSAIYLQASGCLGLVHSRTTFSSARKTLPSSVVGVLIG